jgi:hypothetical protein
MNFKKRMDLPEIRRFLSAVRTRDSPGGVGEARASLASHKSTAVACANQALAKEIWCLEQTLTTQTHYLDAFVNMRSAQFYDAWCALEQAEVSLFFLDHHFRDLNDRYSLEFIRTQISQFQSAFPYRMFFSPGMIHREKKCSVCGTRLSIRNPCGHRAGEIYDGEMCSRIITKIDLTEVSLVTNPRNKYAVGFPRGKAGSPNDGYDYSLVKSIVERLQSPFDRWTCRFNEERVPHSRFPNVGRNHDCPCGSKSKYKRCCLNESGVRRSHCHVEFEKDTEGGRFVL